jgi:hypothetical protein
MRLVDEQYSIGIEGLAHIEPEWSTKLLIFDQFGHKFCDIVRMRPANLWLAADRYQTQGALCAICAS